MSRYEAAALSMVGCPHLIVNVQAESNSCMEGRLRLFSRVDISDLLARHEALTMVNSGINAAIPVPPGTCYIL